MQTVQIHTHTHEIFISCFLLGNKKTMANITFSMSISFESIQTTYLTKWIRSTPANRTLRVSSSAIMQPTDHMSTEIDHSIMLLYTRQQNKLHTQTNFDLQNSHWLRIKVSPTILQSLLTYHNHWPNFSPQRVMVMTHMCKNQGQRSNSSEVKVETHGQTRPIDSHHQY